MPGQHLPAPPSFNQRVIEEFRANGGRVGGRFEGVSLILLITAGPKTGRPHTTPVTCLRDGHRYLIFGSNLGRPEHPGWYHNLLASPQATIEVGDEDGRVRPLAVRAVVLEGGERDRLYERQAAISPAFRDYQERTARTIPVVALYPLDLSGHPERAQALGKQLIAHHASLRAGLSAARAQIEAVADGTRVPGRAGVPVADLLGQLRQRCLTSCYGLRLHHIREDGAFSVIEQQFPGLAPALRRLRAEHQAMAKALTDLEELLQRPDLAPADELLAGLARVTAGLEKHFACEEAELLPTLNGQTSRWP